MRSVWSGSIAFGLVSIPVKLFSAVKEGGLDLDMLDRRDLSNIQFKRVNAVTGKEVQWADIVKGYNLNGKYVVLTDVDFEKASPEKTKLINLELFVKPEKIDVILYDKAYYLSPAKGGERAFNLLEQALKKAGMAGVGSFVLRNKERPVVVRSAQGVLILHTLRFLREIQDPSEFIISSAVAKKNELSMALSLIKNLEGEFNIATYKDTYTAKLLRFIKAKATGKKLPEPKKVLKKPTSDLIEQLQKSLEVKKNSKRKK